MYKIVSKRFLTSNIVEMSLEAKQLAKAALPGYTGGPVRVYYKEYDYQARNRGTSHMQMRNDGGIKEKLYNLLEGDYGHFFKTARK